jgi:hypothetical protein
MLKNYHNFNIYIYFYIHIFIIYCTRENIKENTNLTNRFLNDIIDNKSSKIHTGIKEYNK